MSFSLLHHNALQHGFGSFFISSLQGVEWSKVKGTLEFQFRISPFLAEYKGHKPAWQLQNRLF